jgi:hypothetical protein
MSSEPTSRLIQAAAGYHCTSVCNSNAQLSTGRPARYHIPAGTGLWTPWATLHNVEANWGPTAGQYLPERWLQPGAEYVQDFGAEHADERNGTVAGGRDHGSGDLKHANASTSRNFEMGVSRAKVGPSMY